MSRSAMGTVRTARPCRSGSPLQPGTEGTNRSRQATSTSPSCSSRDRASSRRSLPSTTATPSTSRRLDTMLPVSEPRTTSGRPSPTANRAMINSGALPKVALRNPPTPGPVCSAACSVASPMSQASGTSAAAEAMNSVTSPTSGYPTPPVLEAVLFDWGDTLMQFAYDEALVEAGHRAGLAAIGRGDLPAVDALTARFRERYEPLFCIPGTIEEIEYPGLVRQCLRDFAVEVRDEELERFLEAEHDAWDPSRLLGTTTHALLDSLRNRD